MNHRQRRELIENIQLGGLVIAALLLASIYGTYHYNKQHEQEIQDVYTARPKG